MVQDDSPAPKSLLTLILRSDIQETVGFRLRCTRVDQIEVSYDSAITLHVETVTFSTSFQATRRRRFGRVAEVLRRVADGESAALSAIQETIDDIYNSILSII